MMKNYQEFLKENFDFDDRKIKKVMKNYIQEGNLEGLINFLEDNNLPLNIYNNYALTFSASYGKTNIVKYLMNKNSVDPSQFNYFGLRNAIEREHIDVVKIYMQHPNVDINFNKNEFLKIAIEQNHFEIVKLLLSDPRIPIIEEDSEFFEAAGKLPFKPEERMKIYKMLYDVIGMHPKLRSKYLKGGDDGDVVKAFKDFGL